ncbi:MAG: hypothetical protein JWO60_2138 [Frankiales bacterium]|nr:hypothetical protein [Frankiales bacterium]
MTAPDGLPVVRATLPLWRRTGSGGTGRPALGWALLFVVSVFLVQEGGCTAQAPCAADPAGNALEGLTVVGPFLLWLLPRHARAASLLLMLAWAGTLLRDPEGLPVLELLAAALLLTGWSLVVDRVLRDRERDVAELAAAAPQAVWPGPVPASLGAPPRHDGLRVAAALAVVVGALVLLGLHQVRSDRAQEARAPRTAARVVAHGDDGYRVVLQVDGRRVEVDTLLAADHPVGSVEPVLLVGDEVRLAAEPSDPFAVLALAQLLATAAVVRGVRARRRVVLVRDVLTRPQPVLVLQAAPFGGAALLLAADAGEREGPALALAPVVALHPDDEVLDDDLLDDADDPDDDEVDAPQQVVTAYGLPLPGYATALLGADGVALLPLAPNGVAPDLDALPFRDVDLDRPAAPVVPDPTGEQALRPDALSLLLGRVLVPGSLVGAAVVAATAGSAAEAVLRMLLVLNVGLGGLLRLTARVELQDAALVLRGPLRRRALPWSSLAAAEPVGRDLVVLTREAETVPLPVPPPVLVVLRPQARHARVRAAASVLQARIAAASGAGEPGTTWAPAPAALYGVAVVVALAVGLVLR